MDSKSASKLFVLVPDGSVLLLRVISKDEGFLASGEAARNGKVFKKWKDQQLTNKTVELEMESPDRYVILLDLVFTQLKTSAVVGVTVIIIRPDGTVHSSPWAATFSGTKGDAATAEISVVTRKESNE